MFTDCYATQFRRTSNALTRIYDEALRPVDLRITQFSLLRGLGRLGEATLTQLAAEAALDKTTMSRNVKHLIEAGWVEVVSSADRRHKILKLTGAGAAKIEQSLPYWKRAQDTVDAQVVAALSAPVKDRLLKTLNGVQTAIAG